MKMYRKMTLFIFLLVLVLLFQTQSLSHPHSLPVIDGISIPYNPEFPTAAEGYSNIDGCSDVPDYSPAFNFHNACDNHDRCWRTVGSDPMICNNKFLEDMIESCGGLVGLPVVSDFLTIMGSAPSSTVYISIEAAEEIIDIIITGIEEIAVIEASGYGYVYSNYINSTIPGSGSGDSSGWDWGGIGINFKPSVGGRNVALTETETLPESLHIVWKNDVNAVYVSDELYDTLDSNQIEALEKLLETVEYLTIDQAACVVAATGYKTGVDLAIPVIFPETQSKSKEYNSWLNSYTNTVKILPIINFLILN